MEGVEEVGWTRHRQRVVLQGMDRALRRQVAGLGRETFERFARGLQRVTWTLHRTLERVDRTL
jgi:hypothetical protein